MAFTRTVMGMASSLPDPAGWVAEAGRREGRPAVALTDPSRRPDLEVAVEYVRAGAGGMPATHVRVDAYPLAVRVAAVQDGTATVVVRQVAMLPLVLSTLEPGAMPSEDDWWEVMRDPVMTTGLVAAVHPTALPLAVAVGEERYAHEHSSGLFADPLGVCAARPDLSADVVARLVRHRRAAVRRAAAANPACPPSALADAADDGDYVIRSRYAQTCGDPAVVGRLALAGPPTVTAGAAANPMCPTDVLDILVESRDRKVLAAVAGNPGAPERLRAFAGMALGL